MSEVSDFFDAFLRADTARLERLRQRDEIARLAENARKKCGNCYNWMKSRQCPQEKNVKGMSRGPSCDGYACGSFVSSRRHTANVAAHERAIAATRRT